MDVVGHNFDLDEFTVFVMAHLRKNSFEMFFGCACQTRLPVFWDEDYVVVEFIFRLMGTPYYSCIRWQECYLNVQTEPDSTFDARRLDNHGASPRPEGRSFAPVSRYQKYIERLLNKYIPGEPFRNDR